MKILFAGGGTLGSVTPMLAVADRLRQLNPETKLYWLGTKNGPERTFVTEAKILFKAIPCGKWRRYWSWQNFIDLLKLDIGCLVALYLLISLRPQVVVSAGSFVGVPVGWAAWVLGIPILIHQQDIIPSLSNKLLQGLARKITSVWPNNYFPPNKLVVTGNPVRPDFLYEYKKEKVLNELGFSSDKPILLVVGGGTGAAFLNHLVADNLSELLKCCQIIQIAGENKDCASKTNGFRSFTLVTKEIPKFLKVADLVVTRAGMGFLSELGYLAKPTIIIPIPQSHQEANAKFLESQQAAVVLSQNILTAESFISAIKNLLTDAKLRERLGVNLKKLFPPGADVKIAEIIKQLANNM